MKVFTLLLHIQRSYLKKIFTILFFICLATCTLAQKSWGQGGTEEKIVKFYPNPAVSYIVFDIQRPVEKGYVIQLYSLLGRRVTSVAVSSNKITIPLTDFFPGLYYFQLRDKTGNIVEVNKFQVSK